MAKIKVTLAKSVIGSTQDVRATVYSLGLKKIRSSAIQEDNPAIRGMVHKVRHLVTVEENVQEA